MSLQLSTSVDAPAPRPRRSIHAEQANHAVDAYLLDLITRAIDLEAEMEVAAYAVKSAERTMALVKSGVADAAQADTALATARIKRRTADRKRQLVASLIRAQVEATKADLERVHATKGSSGASRSRLVRLEHRLRILQSAK